MSAGTDKTTPRPWQIGGEVTGPRATALVCLEEWEPGTGFRYQRVAVTSGPQLVAIVPGGEGDPWADAALIVRAVNERDALVAALKRQRAFLVAIGRVERAAFGDGRGNETLDAEIAVIDAALTLAEAP
jgi:hypothetical protein